MKPAIPKPHLFRRIWIPGLQYGNETRDQMLAREARWLAEDAATDSEERRLYEWKLRPVWEIKP